MSHAANPNKQKKTQDANDAADALRQQKQERERIRRLIITLGDDNKKVVGQIKGLVGALEDDIELHGDLIRQTVLDCAQNLPFKTGILANWVTRMFDNHPDWAGTVIAKALEDLRAAVRTGRFLTAQLLLRFLVSFGNTGLVALPEVLQLLQEVLALSQGLRPSKGGDLGVFLALTALPFLGPAAYTLAGDKIDGLVAAAGTYLTARDAKWKSLIRVVKSETPMDHLEAAADMLKALKEGGWQADAVFHLKGLDPCMEAKDDSPHFTPLGITAEEVKKSKIRLQPPLAALRLITARMEADGGEALPGHDRWLLEDFIVCTIEAFAKDVEECAKQLLRFPFMHSHFEAAVIETIFSQMLRLPSPPFLPLFYSRLLQAIVDKENSTLDAVNKGFSALFEKIADLDEESFEVLAEAWAYHLINQSYKADWEPFSGEKASPQAKRFARRVLERLQRLSFHQNLLHRLPEAVHALIPPEPVPATGLPAHAKPEYTRMLSFVRIKDPDRATVLKYCEFLLQVKEEIEVPIPAAENEDDIPEWADEEDLAAKEEDDADKEDDATGSGKRSKAVDSSKPQEGEPEKKRQKVDVKEEVKQEAGGTGLTQAKEEAKDFGDVPSEPWPIDDVVEILALAVFHHGAKTPTHMSKILDGHQEVFLKLRPEKDDDASHDCVKAVVKSVFGFWRLSGQRFEITLETLLNRGIITPRAVVEQALGTRAPEVSDWMSVWNMINSVSRKSLERTQSIRVELAIAKKFEKEDLLEKCRKQLDIAIHETAELFTLIFTELVRSHQDWEDKDAHLRHIATQRVLMIGRKYHAFIRPLIDSAESRIPGVAHNPEIAAVFASLKAL